jgi:D-3-phosphoglycerate dehydrogenase / 2-oxoglutarate reductase
MPKVLMFAPVGKSHEALTANGCEVALGKPEWHTPGTDYTPEISSMAQGAAALAGTSMRASPITKAVIDAAPDLRIVAKATVGVDDVDVDYCTEQGILVTHAPVESNWGNIAEVTVTFLLSLLKRVQEQDAFIKEGGWWKDAPNGKYVGTRLSDGYNGITLGIIGLGRIGMRVAQLMRPWNINIIACDPYIQDYRFLEAGAKPVDLDTLLRESDVVTLHVVLNKETRHMMSTREFSLMKPTAYFINTSRGEAVDEQALCDAIQEGVIAGAGLNAFEEEPLAPDSPLRSFGDKVLLRPHGGTPVYTSGSEAPVGRTSGQNTEWVNEDVLRALRGELPVHIFNQEAIPRWRERFGGKSLLGS